ncbi:MAG: hypothetical protein LBU62_11320, partial [Bacteroidales bacterium]|jgi:hypothetical protein|nr:hypothetical protein [Bacteroidales bacterium]
LDYSGFNFIEFIIGGGFIIFILVNTTATNWFTYGIFGFIVSVCIFGYMLYWVLDAIFRYKAIYVFNRKEGTLTYPDFIWFRQKTVPFDDAEFLLEQGDLRDRREHLFLVLTFVHTKKDKALS